MSSSNTRGQKSPQPDAEKSVSQADMTASFAAMEATLDAMFQRFTVSFSKITDIKLYALEERMNTRIDARSRPSSPVQQTATPQMTPQASQMTLQPSQLQASPTIVSTPQSEDKRWRPEEIGEFDGTGNVQAFVDRIQSVAIHKGHRLVQTHLDTVLKETAFNWYHYELTNGDKLGLNRATSIGPWCTAILKRFGPRYTDLITQLEACHYTRKDAANKKDATSYVQEVLRITKGLGWDDHVKSGINTAFHHFESSLQQTLDPPTDLNSFIDQVQIRQQGWFQIYAGYGKPRSPDPYLRQPPRPQQPYQSRPQQPYQSRPQYSQQARPSQPASGAPGPPQPRVYWADQEEEYEDWEYDAPTDSYHVAHRPPGHTPHRYGNTHDGGGSEARVHWASAGEDHRCSEEGCTHYH